MIKKILLILLFALPLQADYLNTKTLNHCIYDLTPNQNSSGWCYLDRTDGLNYCDLTLTMDDLINGYEYLESNCDLKNDLRITGLTESEWNFFMALLANFLGFTILFLISFLSVLVTRK